MSVALPFPTVPAVPERSERASSREPAVGDGVPPIWTVTRCDPYEIRSGDGHTAHRQSGSSVKLSSAPARGRGDDSRGNSLLELVGQLVRVGDKLAAEPQSLDLAPDRLGRRLPLVRGGLMGLAIGKQLAREENREPKLTNAVRSAVPRTKHRPGQGGNGSLDHSRPAGAACYAWTDPGELDHGEGHKDERPRVPPSVRAARASIAVSPPDTRHAKMSYAPVRDGSHVGIGRRQTLHGRGLPITRPMGRPCGYDRHPCH